MRDRSDTASHVKINSINFFPFHYANLVKPSSIYDFLLDNVNSTLDKEEKKLDKNETHALKPEKLDESLPSAFQTSLLAPFPLCTLKDKFSDVATVAPTEYTELNGRIFPVLYRKNTHKRIILNWPISISNAMYPALIDTGATISGMNPDFLSTIPLSLYRKTRIEPFSINLSVEDNTQYVVEEQVEVVIKVDDNEFLWRFYLVSGLSNDIVLGMDWLHAMQVTIECHLQKLNIGRIFPSRSQASFISSKNEYLSLNNSCSTNPEKKYIAVDGLDSDYFSDYTDLNSSLTSQHQPKPTMHALSVRKAVVLPPFSFTKVKVKANKKISDDVIILPKCTTDSVKQIAYGSSIVKMKDGKATTFFLNLNKRPVRLRENLCIGSCSIFSEENVVCDVDELEKDKSTIDEFLCLLNKQTTAVHDFSKIEKYFKFGESLSHEQKMQLIFILKKFQSSFSSPESPKLGKCPLVKHKIDVGEAMPIKQNPYRVSFKERDVINEQVDQLLNKDLIEHSNSPWSSPVVLVKKPNGGIRFCVDYRKLNSVTIKDNYPLPRIDDALDRLRGAKYFTTLDCDQAYYQIEMEENSKDKTAFITPDGLYNFKVLPFGLSNSPASFQRLIDSVLGRLKWTIALVYMDDIIVFSDNFETHLSHLNTVLCAISKAGLILQASKCSFGFSKLKYLGHIISADGIEVDPEKVRAIKEFPIPKKPRDVQSFVATCSYYRRFIPLFARIAKPLHDMTKKGVVFDWSVSCNNAFEKLKSLMCKAPILGYPDEHSPTEIHCDGSGLGLGCTLVQIQNDEERVVAYASRTLRKHEQHYSATDLECLAVLFSIQKFRPYLFGRPFKIITDHRALCDLINFKDPHGRAARWSMALQPYDFHVVHRAGKKHADADGLSRNPVKDESHDPFIFTKKNDIDDLCLLTDHKLFALCAVQSDSFSNLQYEDPKIRPIIDSLLAAQKGLPIKMKNIENFKLEADILYKARYDPTGRLWRLVVPEVLQKDLIAEIHERDASHLGLNKTWRLVEDRYYWPKIFKTVSNFVRSCKICQAFNRRNGPAPGSLQPIPPPKSPFSRIGIDFVGPYPVTHPKRNTCVFTVIDHLTRYVEAYPCKGETSAAAIECLRDKLFLKHSVPQTIITDKGSCFISNDFQNFCKNYGIKIKFCSTAHPETNAVCERSHDVFQRCMAKKVTNEKNWDKFVDEVVYSYNITHHKVINMSPFFALYGRNPRLPNENIYPVDDSFLSETQSVRHKQVKEQAYRNTIEAQVKNKKDFDKKHRELNLYPGDLVAIKISQKIPGKVQKWQKRWIAPFKVLEQIGPITYKLIDNRPLSERPNRGKEIRIVSTREIKRWYNDFHDNDVFSGVHSPSEYTTSDSEFEADSVSTVLTTHASKYKCETPSVNSSPRCVFSNKSVDTNKTTEVSSSSGSAVSVIYNGSGGQIFFSSQDTLAPPQPSVSSHVSTINPSSLNINSNSSAPLSLSPNNPFREAYVPVLSSSTNPFLEPSPPVNINPQPPPESDTDSVSSSSSSRSKRARNPVDRYDPSAYWQVRKRMKSVDGEQNSGAGSRKKK